METFYLGEPFNLEAPSVQTNPNPFQEPYQHDTLYYSLGQRAFSDDLLIDSSAFFNLDNAINFGSFDQYLGSGFGAPFSSSFESPFDLGFGNYSNPMDSFFSDLYK